MKLFHQVKKVSSILILLYIYPSCFVWADKESGTFNLTEISPGNYVHLGVHVGIDDKQHDDIANIGFIVGDRCVVVIDTGGSVEIGQLLLEKIRGITELPVCYVINTHIHFDHVLGNLAFIDEKPEFIGHNGLADAIEVNRGFFLEQFAADLGPDPSPQSIIGPTRLVQDVLELDLGGRIILLTAHTMAHSHNDLTVFDRKTGTLWTGDLVFRERIPVLDGSLKGWLSVLEILKNFKANCIIPGHGSPGTVSSDVMAAEESYLNILLSETRQALADGLFMEEAIEKIGIDEKTKWLLFDERHRSNVSKAFTELEWE